MPKNNIIRKKTEAQRGAKGICATALGKAIKARPGPKRYIKRNHEKSSKLNTFLHFDR